MRRYQHSWLESGMKGDESTELSESSKSLVTSAFSFSLQNSEQRRICTQYSWLQQCNAQSWIPYSNRHWGRLKQKRQTLNWTRSQHSSSTQWDLSSTYSKQGHRFVKGRGSARYSGSALFHRECLLPIRRKRVLKALYPEIQDLATEEGHFKDPTTTTVWGWV